MSEINDLERLRSKKAELEAESHTLKETYKNMESRLKILEEQITIEELENKNKATRNAIVQLESKMKRLETRLNQASQEPILLVPEREPPEASANPVPSDVIETAKPAETASEDFQENIVIAEAVDKEALVENQENLKDHQEKKKHIFF